MPLPSLSETSEYLNVLYFGEGGSGKTTAAAHMAKLGHIIAVDAESGIKKRPLRNLGVPVGNIHPYTVQSYDDLDRLYWQVKDMLEKDPTSVAGVTFDSMTELQKKLLESIVDARHAKRIASGMVDDVFDVDRNEYGKMTEQVRRICRRFRDLPCHTAFVCLDKRDIDSDGTVVYRPALTPAFAIDLVGYVDIVTYVIQTEGEDRDRSRYLGITRPTGKYRGKDRYGALPTVLANPTFERMVAYVEAEDDQIIDQPYMLQDDEFQEAYYARMTGAQDAA